MKRYEVIWIDDQFDDQEAFLESAYLNGIDIIPFKTSKDGMHELSKNLMKYDAIILDAKVYNESEDEVAKLTGLTSSIYYIKQLTSKKVVPYFIFTGQPDLIDSTTFSEMVGEVFVYKKTIDNAKLFSDLKAHADKQDFTQLKHKHQNVFEACTEKYIGDYAASDLFHILSNIENDDLNNLFNSVRKIVEDIFQCFHKYELLPREFVFPSVSIQESSKFLSGQTQKEFTLNAESRLPKLISDSLRSILDVTQPASHRSSVDEHLKIVNNTYLIKGSVYQLLDIIVWLKNYIDSNPPKNNWSKIENKIVTLNEKPTQYEGIVINFNPYKGFAFFKPNDESENIFIPPHLVELNSLVDGLKISVEKEDYIDNRTEETKIRVTKVNII
jgi:cold shock CspA family protein